MMGRTLLDMDRIWIERVGCGSDLDRTGGRWRKPSNMMVGLIWLIIYFRQIQYGFNRRIPSKTIDFDNFNMYSS